MSVAVQHLSFAYGARAVLTDVSLTAEDGRLVAVLGPNGVGKTTLFRCVLGLLKGYAGEILIDGGDAKRLSARELARRVAYIPQIHARAFGYTALETVLMGAAHAVPSFSLPGKRETEAAMTALDRLGVAHLAARNVARLSGGEQQLVLIARALAQNARTLLMDEPTASLDYGHQARVLSAVRGLADEGYAVLLSTHDPQHALRVADDALALSEGRVAAFGPPKDVLDAALIRRLYHIEASLVDTDAGLLIAPAMDGRRA